MARKTNPAPPVEPQGTATTLQDLACALEGVVHAAETLPKPLRAAVSSALVVRVQMQAKMALTAVQRALRRRK